MAWIEKRNRSPGHACAARWSSHGVFAYAVKRGYLAANPAIGTAPKQSRVKQSRPELLPRPTDTHVAWLVAGGAPLPHIQARLGTSRSRPRSSPTVTCSPLATS